MTRCKSCGAEILWVYTTSGKRMPLDAQPEKRLVLDPLIGGESVPEGDHEVPVARAVDTYVSHFATCPDADKHRKPRGQMSLGA